MINVIMMQIYFFYNRSIMLHYLKKFDDLFIFVSKLLYHAFIFTIFSTFLTSLTPALRSNSHSWRSGFDPRVHRKLPSVCGKVIDSEFGGSGLSLGGVTTHTCCVHGLGTLHLA